VDESLKKAYNTHFAAVFVDDATSNDDYFLMEKCMMRGQNRIFILLIVGVCSLTAWADTTPWRALFDGQSLDGWVQRGGQAAYRVEDGCLIGTTVPNTPNSFMCTNQEYADFILEYEFKVDPTLNSGVQIRSHSKSNYNNGRVHGYQVEIDPNPGQDRWWSAGIYDEARRGWLYPDNKNAAQKKAFTDQGRKLFKQGQWNHVRVEANGSSIRTWLNGTLCADLKDDMDASGFIAFQVHSIGSRTDSLEVAWRNIRICELNVDCPLNQLTSQERADGWKLLFDGKTSKGWRSIHGDAFPTKGWSVKDGVFEVEASGGAESAFGGDIITIAKYANFILDLEFKLTEGANSGIKYFVDPGLNKGAGSAIGLEFQLLDDEKHPDAKLGVKGNRTLGSLYDLIPANTNKKPNPIGQWNHARLVVQGNHVEHWLNGERVVTYEKCNQMYRALVAYSKYKDWPNFGELPEGHILLQDHGDAVSFKNIKIKELD
jgi:hypothetical protein